MEKGDTLTQNREEDKPVELRVLRYFLAVVRMQSISAAAEELHITQPTLSRQLMELEEELGAKLFDRGRKKRRANVCTGRRRRLWPWQTRRCVPFRRPRRRSAERSPSAAGRQTPCVWLPGPPGP